MEEMEVMMIMDVGKENVIVASTLSWSLSSITQGPGASAAWWVRGSGLSSSSGDTNSQGLCDLAQSFNLSKPWLIHV